VLVSAGLYIKSCSREGETLPSPAHIRSTIATIASAPEDLRELRAFYKALGDVTRLRIVRRLAQSPATVTDLVELVDLSQPLVSWHLRALRAAGLIETRRVGREVICSLRHDVFERYARRQDELLAPAPGGAAS
jgi:ArsR family transcriptional regulator